MKGVLFLGLVGVVLYMAIDVSHDLLSSNRTQNSFSHQQINPPNRPLRSWATDLPALATPSPTSRESLIAPVVTVTGAAPAPTYDSTEWVKVRLAARVHREPSVSSPTTQFYKPGTTLQVVGRANGWIKISDPASKQGGWMLEQYLAETDGPPATQTASVANASALSTPPEAKPVRSARKRAHVIRPTIRVPDDVANEQFDARWERRVERRRFGFFFGRYAGAE
jgi:hypothetical protein